MTRYKVTQVLGGKYAVQKGRARSDGRITIVGGRHDTKAEAEQVRLLWTAREHIRQAQRLVKKLDSSAAMMDVGHDAYQIVEDVTTALMEREEVNPMDPKSWLA